MVTKRSGQAETALISRRRATVEQTRCRRPPGKDQGKNKPSTNRTLRHTNSDSPIRRVESFDSARGRSNIITKLSACSRLACFKCETGGPSVGQTGKESAIAQTAARRPSKASLNRGRHAASANHRHQILRLLGPAPCLKQGLAGPSVGQTVKESAMAKSPRAALQRQAAIAAVARAHQVLVNAAARRRRSSSGPTASRVSKLARGFGQALQCRRDLSYPST